MKILLVWPYNQHALDIPETIPLGLGYLAANIKPPHEVSLLDATIDRLAPDSDAFRERLLAEQPDVVGVSFWSSNARSVYASCEVVRQVLPNAVIVFGGPHATSYAKREVVEGRCDYALKGDSELSLPMLLDELESPGSHDLTKLSGLVRKDETGAILENAVEFTAELDDLGRVDYDLLRLDDYYEMGYGYRGKAVLNPHLKSAMMMATRGCPFRCTFCSAPFISGRPLRHHSPRHVADVIESLYVDQDVRLVSLGDDQFTLDTTYAREVCEEIVQRKLEGLVMVTPNGVRMRESMTTDFLALMMRAGWQELTIAPETGSERTLRIMQKDLDLSVVKPFVDRCHEVGLKVKANFILGYPGECPEDIMLTARFIEDNHFDNISTCFFQPLPGTPIFDQLIERGEIEPDFVPARYSQLTYCPPGMSAEWLRDQFNSILNAFRDSKGWIYQNSAVGSIRSEAGEEERNVEGSGMLGALPHTVMTKGSAFEIA
ncbi:MAG: anaerobic magnesium-protoporphyrin IX monomethyl ester cyclase [Planctomycetota bacterium]|jgi:anaerobic magnesium-protoporphyrin IX monomethyl ester cyclase